MNSEKREMLRHFLAALAYRTQKAIRGAPPEFASFDAGNKTRTPHELICHMRSVLGYSRTFFIGGTYPLPKPEDFSLDVERFHEMLVDLDGHLKSDSKLNGIKEEQLLQGPFADAMTHAGQLAMLRRLFGDAVPPENFIVAKISVENLTADQPQPASPDAEWPEEL